jgi:hypothetical protein
MHRLWPPYHELVEGDESVAVLVDAVDHAAELAGSSLLAEGVEDAAVDRAAAVGVEDRKGQRAATWSRRRGGELAHEGNLKGAAAVEVLSSRGAAAAAYS